MFNKVQAKQQKAENKIQTVSESMQQYDVRIPIPGSENITGRLVALDCEMVQCYDAQGARVQKLARISIVNYNGHLVLDQYYKPEFKIVNYLTRVSGITPQLLKDAPIYDQEQRNKLLALLKGKIIIGHSLKNDFLAMELDHEFEVRDIGVAQQFKSEEGKTQSLKTLCYQHLGQQIQSGSHCSIIDARTALYLFRKFRNEINFEYKQEKQDEIKRKYLNKKKNSRRDEIRKQVKQK